MAMILCPECQAKVSSLAITCPHCGIKLNLTPIEQGLVEAAQEEQIQRTANSIMRGFGCLFKAILWIVVAFIGLMVWVAIYAPRK